MRDDGDEVVGMMNARRCGSSGQEQLVTVGVRGTEVRIILSDGGYPAGLTPAQARFIARALYRMARLAEHRATAASVVPARKPEAAA